MQIARAGEGRVRRAHSKRGRNFAAAAGEVTGIGDPVKGMYTMMESSCEETVSSFFSLSSINCLSHQQIAYLAVQLITIETIMISAL